MKNAFTLTAIACSLAFASEARAAGCTFQNNSPMTSAWAAPGTDGKLQYATLVSGDRIMDFSAAGYHAGGAALPDVSRLSTPGNTVAMTARRSRRP